MGKKKIKELFFVGKKWKFYSVGEMNHWMMKIQKHIPASRLEIF
jgi:hypothetical protein